MNTPLQQLQAMQAGAAAAAAVRSNGGLPAHLDALNQPQVSVVEGIVMHNYPAATFATMRLISPWLKVWLGALEKEAQQSGQDTNDAPLPVEVILMQIYSFACPRDAYSAARNGEGLYMKACFDWADRNLPSPFPKASYILGALYTFVLEQCADLDAVNPQPPVPMKPGTAPESLMAPQPSPEPSTVSAPGHTPDSSPR